MRLENTLNRYRGSACRQVGCSQIGKASYPSFRRVQHVSLEVQWLAFPRVGRVQRTARSMELKDRRDVRKAVDPTDYTMSAQEYQNERNLSRSKQYPNKGVNEAARRFARVAYPGDGRFI